MPVELRTAPSITNVPVEDRRHCFTAALEEISIIAFGDLPTTAIAEPASVALPRTRDPSRYSGPLQVGFVGGSSGSGTESEGDSDGRSANEGRESA